MSAREEVWAAIAADRFGPTWAHGAIPVEVKEARELFNVIWDQLCRAGPQPRRTSDECA